MSSIPSRIDDYVKESQFHNLKPIGITNDINPTFILKEDNLLPINIKFTPTPICSCFYYNKSSQEMTTPICHHIVYILTHYYHINNLSIRMYHKLPNDFYETLITYMDTWISSNYTLSQLKKRRKKPEYDFTKETKTLVETDDNRNIFNPMYEYYNEQDCAICLDPLSTKHLMICPECFNYSHKKCAAKWLAKKQGCQFCRDNPSKTKIDENEMFPELFLASKSINQ